MSVRIVSSLPHPTAQITDFRSLGDSDDTGTSHALGVDRICVGPPILLAVEYTIRPAD